MPTSPEYNKELSNTQLAEKRVFGEAYSFTGGVADESVVQEYFAERIKQLGNRKPTWIARSFEAGPHSYDGPRLETLVADLYWYSTVVGTVILDTIIGTATGYHVTTDGTYRKEPLCSDVPFEEAVRDVSLLAIYQKGRI